MEPLDLPFEESIDLHTSYFFPPFARIGAWVIVLFGVLIIDLSNIIVGLIFIVVGIFVITSQHRIKIDFGRKNYFEYMWIFGFKKGDREHFDKIEYIFVNKNKVKQTIAVRVASSSFERYDFNVYLKFSEDQKIHLLSDESKSTVFNRAQSLAERLKCDVVDRTD
jgi:hypothetical protein